MSPHTYQYPRPAVTVDALVLAMRDTTLSVLLIRRKHPPHAGQWALPGGFVDEHEDLADAARRELREETGVRARPLIQLGAYGTPGRDPRGHTVGVAFLALAAKPPAAVADDDAGEVAWFPLQRPPAMAFDHGDMLRDARRHLRRNLERDGLEFQLLPARFTIEQLCAVRAAVLGRGEDFARQARRAQRLPWLERCGDERPVRYRLDRSQWRRSRKSAV